MHVRNIKMNLKMQRTSIIITNLSSSVRLINCTYFTLREFLHQFSCRYTVVYTKLLNMCYPGLCLLSSIYSFPSFVLFPASIFCFNKKSTPPNAFNDRRWFTVVTDNICSYVVDDVSSIFVVWSFFVNFCRCN